MIYRAISLLRHISTKRVVRDIWASDMGYPQYYLYRLTLSGYLLIISVFFSGHLNYRGWMKNK